MQYRLNGMNVARNSKRGAELHRALAHEMQEVNETRELGRQQQARKAYMAEVGEAKRRVATEIRGRAAQLRDKYVRSQIEEYSHDDAERWVYRHTPQRWEKPKNMYELFWRTLRDEHADFVVDYLTATINAGSSGAAGELLGRALDDTEAALAQAAPKITIQ